MTEYEKDPSDVLDFGWQWYDVLRGGDLYWTPGTYVRLGDTTTTQRHALNGKRYRCTIAGRTGTTPPTWPTPEGTVTDGGVTWTFVGDEDRIATSVWSADSALTLSDDAIDATECVTSVNIAGGTAGQSYRVKNTITTDAGRTIERSFVLNVRDL